MHSVSGNEILKKYGANGRDGLSGESVLKNARYGRNVIQKPKPPSVIKRVLLAVCEPMMLILVFALVVTLGINIGKALKTGNASFYECLGIFLAIALSVSVTVIMEDKSRKAIEVLNLAGGERATVLRDGKKKTVTAEDLVVGDVVFLEAGCKVYADMRLLSSNGLKTDEATLTGESMPVKKDANVTLAAGTPLAERRNCVYSGTFVREGEGIGVVAAVGDKTETGKIAKASNSEKSSAAPLNAKLLKLGKTVSVFGGAVSVGVLLLSVVRLAVTNCLSFDSVGEAFVQSILLIVAAVPEGLPATVALSLTLNAARLAKSNAVIKKLVAAETIGSVSVICSDKTGTLTANEMTVVGVFDANGKTEIGRKDFLLKNFALNSTAEKNAEENIGSPTELALVKALERAGVDYKKMRGEALIVRREPFSSERKYMVTEVKTAGGNVTFLKGAPERVAKITGDFSFEKEIKREQAKGMRVLAFARMTDGKWTYDGFCSICDELREDAKEAVEACVAAGVKVKILTGDGKETARYVADRLSLKGEVVEASEIEGLSENAFIKRLKGIAVVARSSPSLKLRITEALKKAGEVVAVTGDGVNDAPAIRHSDVGIAMGSGSDASKEAADVILLDDRFSTIVKAVAFGRSVFGNFQRFISFQLTVNLASMSIIIASLVTGLDCPFTSSGLLWLNVIMDGPLALSLGVENRAVSLKGSKPVKRDADILSPLMMARVGVHSVLMCAVTTVQQLFNFLGASVAEQSTVVLTTFVFFQLFNAVNCAESGSSSSLKALFSNKILLSMLAITLTVHVLLCQFAPAFFSTTPISVWLYIRIAVCCSSVLVFSELSKAVYRVFKKKLVGGKKFAIKRSEVT